MLQAFHSFQAPLPPKAKPATPLALPTALPALLFGANRGGSLCGSSSYRTSTTKASFSSSASSSSSTPSGTNDYVPSESMSEGPAAYGVTRSQASRPKKRARSRVGGRGHATSGRMVPTLEALPLPSLPPLSLSLSLSLSFSLFMYVCMYVCTYVFCSSDRMTPSGMSPPFLFRHPQRSEFSSLSLFEHTHPFGGARRKGACFGSMSPPPPRRPPPTLPKIVARPTVRWLAAAPVAALNAVSLAPHVTIAYRVRQYGYTQCALNGIDAHR